MTAPLVLILAGVLVVALALFGEPLLGTILAMGVMFLGAVVIVAGCVLVAVVAVRR